MKHIRFLLSMIVILSCNGTMYSFPGTKKIGDVWFSGTKKMGDVWYDLTFDYEDKYYGDGVGSAVIISAPDATKYTGSVVVTNPLYYSGTRQHFDVTEVDDYAFLDCEYLCYVQLPSSISTIGREVFSGCVNLSSIIIPKNSSLTNIPNSTFNNCSSLTSITIPESVTWIGRQAFYNCSSLTSITIPEDVTNIGDAAFYNCSSLSSITCYALTPPKLGSESFKNVTATLFVPEEAVNDYENAEGWSEFQIEGLPSWIPITPITDLSQLNNSTLYHISPSRAPWAVGEGGDALKSVVDLGIEANSGDPRQWFAFISYDNGNSHYLYHAAENKFIDKEGGLGEQPKDPIYFKAGTDENTFVMYFDEEHYINVGGSNQMVIDKWCTPDEGNSCSIYAVREFDPQDALNKEIKEIGTLSFLRTNDHEAEVVSALSDLDKIEIPERITIDGILYNVTSIGNSAFKNCNSLTTITIPECVTSIGNAAFMNCNNLTSITVPEGMTNIAENALDGTAWYANQSDGVVYVSNVLYKYKGEMPENTSVEIKESAVSISPRAFYGYSNLASITIPEGVISVGRSAFEGCSGLTSIDISENSKLTSIEESVFRNCSGLTSITIPASVTTIGEYAFYDCNSLVTFIIPESVKAIGKGAFHGCTGELIINCNIPSRTSDSYSTFSDSKFNKLTIGNKVTSIGDYAFSECTNLNSVNVLEGCTTIGKDAFSYCTGITSVNLAEGVNSIGTSAFYGCTNLPFIAIPKSVTSLGNFAFCKCSSLTDFAIPEGIATIGWETFANCSSLISISIPSTVTAIKKRAFAGCSNLKYIALPEGIASIETDSFKDCSSLCVILNSSNVKSWFTNNTAIKEIVLSENVNSVENRAFAGCSSLTSITIPESVTSIGSSAFYNCCSLLSLTIGTNVDSYGTNVFAGCTSVEELMVKGSVMPMVPSDKFTKIIIFSPGPLDTEEFDPKVYRTATLYVPKGSLARYQVADVWKKFWNIKEFNPNGGLNITIGQYETRTFCPAYALDFSEVEGLKAYVATGYNTATGEVTLTRVMTAKPGEGLFLKGKPGDYEVPTLKNPESCMQNLLVGTLRNTIVNATSDDGLSVNYEYTAKGEDTAPLFYRINDNVTLEAGKAYLQLPKAWIGTGATRAIGLRFDNEEMEFGDEEQPADVAAPAVIYDLQGRRVANPTKGVFIVNGKKLVFK